MRDRVTSDRVSHGVQSDKDSTRDVDQPHSGKAYEATCRIPRQNGDGRGIASAKFVWIVKAIESAAIPHVVCGYKKSISNICAANNVL